MRSYAFTVLGNPVPKARARVGRRGAWTPKQTAEAEEVVRAYARQAGIRSPLAGPVRVDLRFFRSNDLNVDLDNLVKLVLDALNRVAWRDDRQVVALTARKDVDPGQPRTMVYLAEATDRDVWDGPEPLPAGKDLRVGPP